MPASVKDTCGEILPPHCTIITNTGSSRCTGKVNSGICDLATVVNVSVCLYVGLSVYPQSERKMA